MQEVEGGRESMQEVGYREGKEEEGRGQRGEERKGDRREKKRGAERVHTHLTHLCLCLHDGGR